MERDGEQDKGSVKEVEEKRGGKRVVRKGWWDEECWIMKKEVRMEEEEREGVKLQGEEKGLQGIM